jgi:hypothetical protein
MGELQHGVYDDDWDDLTSEEINMLHGFRESGDENKSDQADSDSDTDLEPEDTHSDESDREERFNCMESSDHESELEVHFSYPESGINFINHRRLIGISDTNQFPFLSVHAHLIRMDHYCLNRD